MKAPLSILTSVGLLAACVFAQAASAQSGVRIKLPRHHAQARAAVVSPELPMPVAHVPYMPEISQWCDEIAAILGEDLADAAMSMQMGDLASAKQILDRALKEASASIQLNPNLRKPLTKVMIDRGIVLSAQLDHVMGNSQPELMAKLNFLSGFVKLVIEKSSEMDSMYYLPYYYQYGACGGHCPAEFDFESFQNRMIEFGQSLLVFTYEQLTLVSGNGIFPAGDPRVFLNVAELVSCWVAQDVSSTLVAYNNACTIADLRRLSMRLHRFNHGMGGYPSYPIAVAVARQELEWAASNLSELGCRR